MKRNVAILIAVSIAVAGVSVGLTLLFASGSPETEVRAAAEPGEAAVQARPGETADDLEARRRAAHAEFLDREFPLHGLVTATQLSVRAEPSAGAVVIGWLRLGGRPRLKDDRRVVEGCATGWYPLYPRGWACAGQGIEVGAEPPEAPAGEGAADRSAALPYRYLVVREPQVPEYHNPPSRDDQRGAQAHAARYLELLNGGDERRAQLLREGRLPNEPRSPNGVARYLERGFFVASNAVEVRSSRRFVRTVRGTYIKEAQLIERTGSDFQGVELTEQRSLPIAFAVRVARPMIRRLRADGTIDFADDEAVEPYQRQQVLPWLRRERHGAQQMHVLEGDRFLRAWFASVAERRDPPAGIASDEPWVHVDLGEQTLVVYRGPTPIYATLVSTGLEGHDTPAGEYTIRRKFVSDTMANLGPDAGDDAYRIEDVPWTQYFEGSFALHGAFWHSQFGLRRSHGCVNLAPRDARYVFDHTWPEIPEGWHGVSTERSGFRGSRVVVTE